MKNYLIIILFLVVGPAQIAGQYYDYYEWGEDNFKKNKFDKAEKYFNKAVESCQRSDVKAACWFYLMDLYKNSKPNDSLYLVSKKALVRNGYETPTHQIEYINCDPTVNIPRIPAIDLYDISRELCCELFEKKEFDSALYYFNTYASKYHEKGWCGVGKQNNAMYDHIIESRIYAALGDTVMAFKFLKYYLAPSPDPYESSPIYYVAIFSFYENIMTLYPQYKKGDMLREMRNNLEYISFKSHYLRFKTRFRDQVITFTEDWLPGSLEDKVDTNQLVDSMFQQTLLYRMIELKDQLRFDTIVTLRGSLSVGTGYAVFSTVGITINISGWNWGEHPEGTIEITGKWMDEKKVHFFRWNDDSELVCPDQYRHRKLKLISYKTLTK